MMPGDSEPLRPPAPADAPPLGSDAPRPGPVVVPYPSFRWHHKAGALLLTIFCMAIGVFLIIYPWTESWDRNYFAVLVPGWHQYWDNLYVRGAVTGLGFVNFYISLAEVIRLRRFSRR
jgi:hypothetical protein